MNKSVLEGLRFYKQAAPFVRRLFPQPVEPSIQTPLLPRV